MIRMPRPTIALVLLAGLLSTAACGTVNTTSTRSAPSEDSVETTSQINDLFTEIFLHVRGVRKFPTRSGVLRAQVDVANDGFSTRGFSYLFTWQDERGNPILGPMHVWKTARVAAGGSITISSVAPGPEATDFSIQVRRAEN